MIYVHVEQFLLVLCLKFADTFTHNFRIDIDSVAIKLPHCVVPQESDSKQGGVSENRSEI